MENNIFVEKSLKRYIKSKKIGYTASLLVGFLITGNIIYGESVSINKSEIEKKIEENNRRIEEIERRTVELLKEGDYYAKTLEDNKQFFFPLEYEHRHASKGHKGTEIILAMPIVPPGAEGGPTITKPGMEIIKPGKPGGPIVKPSTPNIADKIEVLVPNIPKLPEKDNVNAELNHIQLGEIPEPMIESFVPEISENMIVPEINKNTITSVDSGVGKIEIDKYIDIEHGADKVINITEAEIMPNAPHVEYDYIPKEPTMPELPVISGLTAPTEIKLPEIEVNTTSFSQGAGGIISQKTDPKGITQAVVENYGKYSTTGNGVEITFEDTKNSDGSMKNEISYKGIEEGNLHIETVKQENVNKEENKKPEKENSFGEVKQETIKNELRKEFYNKKDNKNYGETATFISTTMGKDSSVEGKYILNYGNSAWNNATRIFLSVNSAGMNWVKANSYDNIGTTNGGKIDDTSAESKKAVLTDFNGNLTLKNDIISGKHYGTLVGIDHQLWDDMDKDGMSTDIYRKSYSIAKNSGIINLGEIDGQDKNLIGISIETENNRLTKHKVHNHVTLNAGEININGQNSIGIGFENGGKVADDLYVGNINFNDKSKESYGLRLKNSNKNDDKAQFNSVRIFGSVSDNINLNSNENANSEDLNIDGKIDDKLNGKAEIKKISVNGNNNGGFVIAKSLSSNATRYLKKDAVNKGDDMPTYTAPTPAKPEEYLGIFADDIKIKNENGEEVTFEGYDNGKVDPLANVHGLNIEVSGKTNVGFLRHRDYSNNNANEMVITNTSTSAIKDIDFNNNASGSVLIRSDMYGIKVEKDLTIEGNGVGTPKEENINQNLETPEKNIILQATKSIWEKDGKKVKSIGNITNAGTISSKLDNIIGMMVNDVTNENSSETVTELNGYKGVDDKGKAEIKNTKDIILNGKNVIGMAVLGENVGILENGKIDTTMKEETKPQPQQINESQNINENKDYNVSVYNNGEFNILSKEKSSEIFTSGEGSVAIYNTGTTTLSSENGNKNIIKADNGAIGLYSESGTIISNGTIEINSESKENEKGGIGIYGDNGAKITIGNNSKAKTEKENKINIVNGSAGIVSKGDKTEITLNNTDMNYSGDGYALYDENGGKININNSTINLGGKSAGMKVTWGEGNNNIKFDKDSKIVVNSNNVVVFNIVAGKGENDKLNSDLSKLKGTIGEQLGNIKIDDLVIDGKDKDGNTTNLYKDAMVDGGALNINHDISQTDEKNTDGEFYFKKFLGVRLNTTVKENVNVKAEISEADANKYFDGKVTGLEIVSSKNAEKLSDTSITLEKGATVTANRLDGEQTNNSATVGIFSNYAKVDMKDGSKIVVENETEKENDKIYKGVGLFAVNGSEVNIGENYNSSDENKNAEVKVFGDNAVGVYAKASRIEKNEILDNEYGNQEGQGLINVTNNGIIDVSNGNGTIGIYANNNHSGTDLEKHGAKDNHVVNNGSIKVGTSDKNNSSVGIYGVKTSINNVGTIEVGDGKPEDDNNIHSKKYGGVGIYATKGTVVEHIGSLVLGDYATGVVVDAESEITDKKALEFKANPNNNENKIGKNKIGIAYNNTGRKDFRSQDFDIIAEDVVGLRAIATRQGTLNINNNITIGDNDNRGVVVAEGKAINNGTITIKENKNQNNKISSVGMVAMEKNSNIENKGTITIDGNSSIGMFVKNEDKSSNNTIGDIGTINLNGRGNTGVYIKNSVQDLKMKDFIKNDNTGIKFGEKSQESTGIHIYNSDIVVAEKGETIAQNLENSNILLKATSGEDKKHSVVINNGILEITSTEKANKVVGIALDEESVYKSGDNGEIHVKGGAIGLYSKAGAEKEFDNLKLSVDSQNQNAIGFALRGQIAENGQEEIENSKVLLDGTTKVTLLNTHQDKENPDSKEETENRAVGIIVRDTDLAINKMELDYKGSSGIGIYLKDDASIKREDKKENLLHITGQEGKEYSVGIYANGNSGSVELSKTDVDIDIKIDKDKTIGVYNDKENLVYNGKIDLTNNGTGIKDSIGIYNDDNKNLIFSGEINVKGKDAESEASAGIYAENNSSITNKGTITTDSSRDVGIYGNNSTVINENKIVVNGGTGVYLAGENSIFNGENGTITTGNDDKSQTAIYLSDGAKLSNGAGNIELNQGDVGIYADRTIIDGNGFISKDYNKRGMLFISSNKIKKNENGFIGIASENSEIKNINMVLEGKGIGIYGIDGKIKAENIYISSKAEDTVTGIYVGNQKDKSISEEDIIDRANINLKNGYGIVIEDSEVGKGTSLIVQDSWFEVKNTLKDKNSSAIVVGKNNKLTSKENYFNVINNVGIYGTENSNIDIQNSRISLSGKSTGIYSNGGNVKIDKLTKIRGYTDKEVNGGAVYVKNGSIESGAEISGIFSNFYGLAVDGNGSITNTGNINIAGKGDIAISLKGISSDEKNKIDNSGDITIEGTEENTSIGIYGKNSHIINEGNLLLKDDALGILYDNSDDVYKDYVVKSNGEIKIKGSNSVGAILKGSAKEIFIDKVIEDNNKSQNSGNNMGIYANNVKADKFTVNNISLKDNTLGMYLNNSNTSVDIGSIVVEDGVGQINGKANSSIAVGVLKGEVTLNIKDKISAGTNGTAILNEGGKITINDITKLSVGAGHGSLIHNNGGTIIFKDVEGKDKYDINVNGHYGFILENGGKLQGDKSFQDKEFNINISNNGTGIIFSETDGQADKNKPFSDLGIDKITITGAKEENGRYTKGIYYKNLGKITEDLENLELIQSGKNTAGLVLNNTYGDIKTGDVVLGEEAENSVAILVKGNENSSNVTNITGNITVKDSNKGGTEQKYGNIGIETQNSSVSTVGNIIVGEGFDFENRYPVGVYAVNNNLEKDYTYTGKGELKVGNFASGVVGKNFNIIYNGNVNAGVGAIGILAENDKYISGKHKTEVLGNITVGDEKLSDRIKGIGVYGKNSDIIVGSKNNSIEMNVKNNKQNMGILSSGEGNIEFTGNVNITGNEKVTKGENSSIGIYKLGSGTVNINSGDWTVGENSFGVIANSQVDDKFQKESGINLTNISNMEIKKGSVGIYSLGNNTITNDGNISLKGGIEDSTVGIYMQNDGGKISSGINKGTITADGKNSVGVQAVGNVKFVNSEDGIINALNEGIGMYAVNGATIQNDGIINLGDEKNDSINSQKTIGMYGAGQGTSIINNGTINANHGTGMYVENGASLLNNEKGNINIKNGIGIKGNGNLVNKGNITLEKGYNGIIEDNNENSNSLNTIIKIQDNVAIIGENYTGIGGTIDSEFDLKLENPTIDITSGNGLGFDAPNISGGITPTLDFIKEGNGYSFDVKDFAEDGVNIDINTSPLFAGKIEDGDLLVNKIDYKDVLKDYQYKEFYDALDDTLKTGVSEDIEALKNLNTYLESLKNSSEFYEQYDKTMGETRGNIYSHIQSRMQDINRAFDNAFDEMEQSYNLSKDTDKFSVIYTNGDYKNHKIDIPNYEYRIIGLMCMKEYEGIESRNKYGYSYGFTGSKFKFDDTGKSEEDIYSLKGGVHNVKYFDKDLNLLTKLEVGINYHKTDRNLVFGSYKYENNSDFWSYHISFDNKFRKTLYKDYQNEFGAYLGFETEYGRFTNIKEDGTLALKIKENDYLSAKAVSGFNGTARKYLGNDWTGKIVGDIGYSYDFGKNYKENSSKIKNSENDYISLMNEVETRGKVLGKIGIGVERLNHMGVTLEGEVGKDFARDEDYWKVGVRFNYKFNSEDAVTTLRNTFNLFGNHFDFDKDTLKRKEQDIIEAGSKIIDKYNLKGTLVLEGHTDSYGSVEYNQGLSERRAKTVKKELMSQIKKSENIKYKTKGFSELKPVDTNKTKEGRANNRRVEVKYISDTKR